MNQYIEVMQKSLVLAETMLEATDYLHRKTIEGRFKATAGVFTDTVAAFQEINQALQLVFPKLKENRLEEVTSKLFEAFDMVSCLFNEKSHSRVLELVENVFLPRFGQWHTELKRCLKRYILS
jgi:hypothetical protein